jgi:hypothetical protein
MKNTGKKNFNGDDIMQIEESDINWREVEFEDLTDNEKGNFLSFIKAPFLSSLNQKQVTEQYNYYRDKNLMEL